MVVNFNLALPFYRNSLRHPERLALSVQGEQLTYSELARLARSIAGSLRFASTKPRARVAILASRSIEACAGTLGACWVGATYVPISLKLPEERLINVLASTKPDALIADARGAELLSERVVAACPNLILKPDESEIVALPNQRICSLGELSPVDDIVEPVFLRAEDIAYIIFTSGTTGVSKGVMISAGSLHHFLSVMQE
jgi:D-alanine--poly(phosphoribitol) ligase subunit 1